LCYDFITFLSSVYSDSTEDLKKKKNNILAGHQWLMPVILATWEVEVSRITVQSQPGQIVHRDPIFKKIQHKIGLVEWLTW
jgi:hypothetical protein